MNSVIQRNTCHIISEIDIQLWAREQRRRWFARTFAAPLSKLSREVAQAMLRAMSRLLAHAGSALLLNALAKRSVSR